MEGQERRPENRDEAAERHEVEERHELGAVRAVRMVVDHRECRRDLAAAPIPNIAKKTATRYGCTFPGTPGPMLGMKRNTAAAVRRCANTRIRFRPMRSHSVPR